MLVGDLGRRRWLALTGGEAALDEVGLEVLAAVLPMLAGERARRRRRRSRDGRTGVGRVEARRRAHPGAPRTATRCASSRATSTTSPTGCPSVVERVRGAAGATQFVLDGEAIGVDDDGAARTRFQDTMSRFGRDDAVDGTRWRARAFFFDVLHVDGDDLLDRPLARAARTCSTASSGRGASPAVVTDDADVAAAFLDDALAAGHEGVMVKALDSTYEAGRRGGSWRKVKPVHTLDLVVLAAEWGHGRRQGWLSNLHLGARDPDGDGS